MSQIRIMIKIVLFFFLVISSAIFWFFFLAIATAGLGAFLQDREQALQYEAVDVSAAQTEDATVPPFVAGPNAGSSETPVAEPETAPAPAPEQQEAEAAAAPSPTPSEWVREVWTDEFEGRQQIACVRNTPATDVRLRFPYHNATHAFLCVRQTGMQPLELFIRMNDRAQFICEGFSTCDWAVSVDGNVETWHMSSARVGQTHAIFVNNADARVRQINQARELRVRAEFFQSPHHAFEFPVSGLDW